MDNVAYYEHARLTVRHSSGTSFTPGAPLHSACLGSPEFYRRNEGDGWLRQNSTFLRPPSVDLPTRRAGTNENESEPSTLRLRSDYSLPVHRGLFLFAYLHRIFIQVIFIPGILFISREPQRESPMALSPVLFLGRARAYPIYLRLSQAAPYFDDPTDHFVVVFKRVVWPRQPERDYQYLVLCIPSKQR